MIACSRKGYISPPIWTINNEDIFSPCDLPEGHWMNASGLVIQAQQEFDTWQYQCKYLRTTNDQFSGFTSLQQSMGLKFELSIMNSSYGKFITSYHLS